MTDINPYEPPREQSYVSTFMESSTWRSDSFTAMWFIITMMAVSTVAGGAIACGLNLVVPDYYPCVFPRSRTPIQDGVFAGLGQGAGIGLVFSTLLVAGLEWIKVGLQTITLIKATSRTLMCGICFAATGALCGYCNSKFSAGYYGGNETDVGIGLGTSQGLMLGLIVGAIGAVTMEWRESRRRNQAIG